MRLANYVAGAWQPVDAVTAILADPGIDAVSLSAGRKRPGSSPKGRPRPAGHEFLGGSRYGNAGAIFTASGEAARRYRYGAEAGMLGVNVGVPAPVAWFSVRRVEGLL